MGDGGERGVERAEGVEGQPGMVCGGRSRVGGVTVGGQGEVVAGVPFRQDVPHHRGMARHQMGEADRVLADEGHPRDDEAEPDGRAEGDGDGSPPVDPQASPACAPGRRAVGMPGPARCGQGDGAVAEAGAGFDRCFGFGTHRGGASDSQGLLSHDAATVPQGATTGRLLGLSVGPAVRVGASGCELDQAGS